MARYLIVFEDMGGGALTKAIAGYHQYHSVNIAVQETVRAARTAGFTEPYSAPTNPVVIR